MTLYTSIAQRQSCRTYDMRSLGAETMAEIERAIGEFEPLYPDVPLDWRFTDQVKGRFHVEAPHYLIVIGQGRDGEKENAEIGRAHV